MIVPRTWGWRGSGIAAVVSCSVVLFGGTGPAAGADVEITANTTSVNLDTHVGSTVHVATGVTVGPPSLPSGPAINATLQAWTLTNDGSLFGDNTVNFTAGGTVNNNLGATISSASTSAIVLGDFFLGGAGAVTNAGSISGGPFADAVELFGGGTVTNLATGSITATNGNNAVSISGGSSNPSRIVTRNFGLSSASISASVIEPSLRAALASSWYRSRNWLIPAFKHATTAAFWSGNRWRGSTSR